MQVVLFMIALILILISPVFFVGAALYEKFTIKFEDLEKTNYYGMSHDELVKIFDDVKNKPILDIIRESFSVAKVVATTVLSLYAVIAILLYSIAKLGFFTIAIPIFLILTILSLYALGTHRY